jgi:hypothetical protein
MLNDALLAADMFYYTYDMLHEMAECRVRLQFTTYEALKPVDIGKDDEGHSKVQIDVLVKAPYQTMLQNGMQVCVCVCEAFALVLGFLQQKS